MSMDLQGKSNRLLNSFKYAFEGILHVVKHERNMKIHLIIATIAIILSFLLSISNLEFMIIILLIGGVLSLEAVNTAIERVVDLVTDEYQPLAKVAKDVAAGAVLIFTIISVLLGMMIFLRPFVQFVKQWLF